MAAAKRKKKTDPPPGAPTPASRQGSWRRRALLAVAGFYLVVVWLDGVGSNLPARLLPRSLVFFGQIAALFRWAGEKQIDYRAEGWVCDGGKWIELDVRPFFPLDADNKESRFYRAVQFHRRDRKVMRALEEFVMERHNRTRDPKIAGVRFLSLRVPYPEPGTTVTSYERRPLETYPAEQRHHWYFTPKSKLRERCGASAPMPPPSSGDEEAAP